MRQAEKARKKFQSRIPFILNQGQKIPKKIAKKLKKTNFQHYFQTKRDEIGREREKKILVPNSVPTQPKLENSEKNSKKIQKIKNPLSGIIFSQNGMRQADKERKKFQSRILFLPHPSQKIPKKNSKKFKKIKKTFSGIIFRLIGMRQPKKVRKKFSPEFRSYLTRARKFRKKQQKN